MEFRKRQFKSYIQPGRLQDVLALIQVLGLDEHAHRSESGLLDELCGPPRSAPTWDAVADDHREFFRVRPDGEHRVSLLARHVVPKLEDDSRQIPPEFIGKLMQSAIDLHDRQIKRDERWAYWVPILVALLAGLFSLAAIILRTLVECP